MSSWVLRPPQAPNTMRSPASSQANRIRRALRRSATHVEQWRSATGERLAKLVARHGSLSAKAFPGRAAILLRLLGVDTETFAEAFEKPGSMKIGHYVPGTRIPIRSDDELFARAAHSRFS